MVVLTADIGSTNYYQALALRDAVLRKPLNLFFGESDLAEEVNNIHFVGIKNHFVIATAQWVKCSESQLKMRQVAVHPSFQKQGYGLQLMLEMEQWAALNGYQEVVLHARETAMHFYEKLSYEIIGDCFEEVGIPHFKMKKRLSSCL